MDQASPLDIFTQYFPTVPQRPPSETLQQFQKLIELQTLMQSLCTDMEVKNPGPGKLSTALTSIDGASLALRVNPDYLQMNLLPPSNNNLMKAQA